jgi:hypothetical protein
MRGAIPQLPNTSSWRAAQLRKAQGLLYFHLYDMSKGMKVILSIIYWVMMSCQGVEGKGKVAPVLFLTEHHAMKADWGSGVIAPLIL